MIGLTGTVMLIVGVPLLALQLASMLLTKALQSYSRSRLEEYCDHRKRPERADDVIRQDERTGRASEAISVVSGLLLAAFLGVAMDRWHQPPSMELLVLIVLAIGGVGYILSSVLGEVLAEPILFTFWPAAHVIRKAAWPLTRGFEGLRSVIEHLAGNPEHGPRPASVEVEIPAEDGDTSEDVDAELPEGTHDFIQRALELARTDVSEIMRPAPLIVSLSATVSAQAAADEFRRSGRSRIPLYGINRDDIVGILLGKDLWERMLEADAPDSVVPASLVRPAYFVPETAKAFQLIDDLRGNRTQMAIVLDEYGAVAGLITLEDLLEQLVGPIDDEHDVPTPDDPIRPLGGARYEVDAALPLEVLNERFDLDLPTDEDFQTVGGLVFHALGRLPERGATFRHGAIELTILDVQDHSIRRVMIDLQPVGSTSNGP